METRKDFKKGMSMILTMVMIFTMVMGSGMFVTTEASYADTSYLKIDGLNITSSGLVGGATTYFYKDDDALKTTSDSAVVSGCSWYVVIDPSTTNVAIYLSDATLTAGIFSLREGYNFELHLSGVNTINELCLDLSINTKSGVGCKESDLTIYGTGTLNISASDDTDGVTGLFASSINILEGANINIELTNTNARGHVFGIEGCKGAVNVLSTEAKINVSCSALQDYGIYARGGISIKGECDINCTSNGEEFTRVEGLSSIVSGDIKIETSDLNINLSGVSAKCIGVNNEKGDVTINSNCKMDLTGGARDLFGISTIGDLYVEGDNDIDITLNPLENGETHYVTGLYVPGEGKTLNVGGSGKISIDISKSNSDSYYSGFYSYDSTTIDGDRDIEVVLKNSTESRAFSVGSIKILGSGDIITDCSDSTTGYGIFADGSALISGSGIYSSTINNQGAYNINAKGDITIGGTRTISINDNDLNRASKGIYSEGGNIEVVGSGNIDVNVSHKAESIGADCVGIQTGKTVTFAGIGTTRVYAGERAVSAQAIGLVDNFIKVGNALTSVTQVNVTDPAITTAKAVVIGEPDPEPKHSGGGKATPSYNITENGNTPETTGTTTTDKQPSNNNGSTNTVNKGDVKISTKNATVGQKVTVTVNEGIGFVLDDLTIKTADGKEVKAVDNGDGTYTFEMPAGAVDIEPIFAPDPKVLEKYQDLNPEEYYYQPVAWADKKGITNGVDGKNFGIDSECTRAQMVTFLWRMAGCPEVKYATGFADVKADSYYEQAVAWATSMGYVKGIYVDQFAPDQVVNRCQTVAIMARMAGVADNAAGYTHGFTDVNANAYYSNAVAWASQNGITSGRSATQFAPNDDCFRQELITFLFRFDK